MYFRNPIFFNKEEGRDKYGLKFVQLIDGFMFRFFPEIVSRFADP